MDQLSKRRMLEDSVEDFLNEAKGIENDLKKLKAISKRQSRESITSETLNLTQ